MHQYIREAIQRSTKKSISITDFMSTVLYHQHLGYYMKKTPLGQDGDFITSPEISQLFGEIVAIWLIHHWGKLGHPAEFALVELGPGAGTLMQDIARVAQKFPAFYRAMRIHMVEISPTLRAIQRKKLHGHCAHWHHTFEEVPDLPLLLVANEFLDALPMNQYIFTDHGWQEIRVTVNDDKLCLAQSAIQDKSGPHVSNIPINSIIEQCDAGLEIIRLIERKIAANSGAGLIVDYGYVTPPYRSTIQSLRKHQYNHFLENVGDSDITYHVDFASLQKSLSKVQFSLMSQRDFLYLFGIKDRLNILVQSSTAKQQNILRSGFTRLTENMGTLFKVLSIFSQLKEH